MIHPDVVPFAEILLAGLPVAPRPQLTPHELSRCVELLGRGQSLEQAFATLLAARPSLPFPTDGGR